jgi:hypothetical protein
MQEFKDILNIGKKDRELSKAEDLKFVLFNGYDSKFSDPVISDNYVIVEKRYARIANIMLTLHLLCTKRFFSDRKLTESLRSQDFSLA